MLHKTPTKPMDSMIGPSAGFLGAQIADFNFRRILKPSYALALSTFPSSKLRVASPVLYRLRFLNTEKP